MKPRRKSPTRAELQALVEGAFRNNRRETPGDADLLAFCASLSGGNVPDDEVMFRLADAFWRILQGEQDPKRALRLAARGRRAPSVDEIRGRARIAIMVQQMRDSGAANRDEAIARVAQKENKGEATVKQHYTDYQDFAAAFLKSARGERGVWLDFNRANLQRRDRPMDAELTSAEYHELGETLKKQTTQRLKSRKKWPFPERRKK